MRGRFKTQATSHRHTLHRVQMSNFLCMPNFDGQDEEGTRKRRLERELRISFGSLSVDEFRSPLPSPTLHDQREPTPAGSFEHNPIANIVSSNTCPLSNTEPPPPSRTSITPANLNYKITLPTVPFNLKELPVSPQSEYSSCSCPDSPAYLSRDEGEDSDRSCDCCPRSPIPSKRLPNQQPGSTHNVATIQSPLVSSPPKVDLVFTHRDSISSNSSPSVQGSTSPNAASPDSTIVAQTGKKKKKRRNRRFALSIVGIS